MENNVVACKHYLYLDAEALSASISYYWQLEKLTLERRSWEIMGIMHTLGKKQAGAQQARKMRLTNQLAEPNPPRTVTRSCDAISQKSGGVFIPASHAANNKTCARAHSLTYSSP